MARSNALAALLFALPIAAQPEITSTPAATTAAPKTTDGISSAPETTEYTIVSTITRSNGIDYYAVPMSQYNATATGRAPSATVGNSGAAGLMVGTAGLVAGVVGALAFVLPYHMIFPDAGATGTGTFHALAMLRVVWPTPVSPGFRRLVLNIGKSNWSDLQFQKALQRDVLLANSCHCSVLPTTSTNKQPFVLFSFFFFLLPSPSQQQLLPSSSQQLHQPWQAPALFLTSITPIMGLTIAFEIPTGAEAVISVLLIVASLSIIWTFMPQNTTKKDKSIVCNDRYSDYLAPLGESTFKASELIPRREQDILKQQISTIERNRQAAFTEIGRIYARRVQIDKALDETVEALKKEFPHDFGPALPLKKKIRDLSREMEQCYGMADDICHQMHQMMVQRLSLRRRIDRIDMQLESARIAEIMHPHIIATEALGDPDREEKKRGLSGSERWAKDCEP
ncbi:hypothetical protein FNAPI_12065 [Fusarium napiforme]|uniref:Uncharacterized protein n=1 Tax=Fusarium napiforme TaxID=42672 RepID=A0A8H5IGA8_9HYPO|nr:hypothetical protein FNAPI_12065 [Fusarium napiforme]